jgi:hypothetical protein
VPKIRNKFSPWSLDILASAFSRLPRECEWFPNGEEAHLCLVHPQTRLFQKLTFMDPFLIGQREVKASLMAREILMIKGVVDDKDLNVVLEIYQLASCTLLSAFCLGKTCKRDKLLMFLIPRYMKIKYLMQYSHCLSSLGTVPMSCQCPQDESP